MAAALTGDAAQLGRPDHDGSSLSELPPGEIFPERSAELADHPYKSITRISAVLPHPVPATLLSVVKPLFLCE